MIHIASRSFVGSPDLSRKHFEKLAGMRLLALVALLCLVTAAWGQDTVLYSFTGGVDGDAPVGGVVRDSAGNLYGSTPNGGDTSPQACTLDYGENGCGVVYKLSPNGSGGWTETVIHTFTSGSDGSVPLGNLVMDGAGNLFGTTEYGGSPCGCGTVFELSPTESGPWTETILYNFKGGADGDSPQAGLIFDSLGNLYGTTSFGANSGCDTLGCGTVFELTNSGGAWTKSILYAFQDGADGGEPGSELVMDGAGNLYGTAPIGGNTSGCNPPYGCGTVYELSPGSSGWTETPLYTFQGNTDGAYPVAGLAIDQTGNLYGNLEDAGTNTWGYIYRLSPASGGAFNFVSIYSFNFTDGARPMGTPLIANRALYGTVSVGGHKNQLCTLGCGGVYRLTPASGGGVSYTFRGFGNSVYGALPEGDLSIDSSGNLVGTTSKGGADNSGTVFEIKPPLHE
jgi:uncharacterized repeat protein (TIGR03803 family)